MANARNASVWCPVYTSMADIEMLRTIEKFYGDKPDESPDFACIINRQHFDRLSGLLSEGTIISGGESDASSLYIEPTLIETSLDSRLMEEEIFGPILPIITYRDLDEAIAIINERPKPLALYLFTNDEEKQERVLKKTSSGGVCINDTL
ncbi:MAG: aldehyde dehydrogenase family protein, partial [Chloroflexi bacterium]|nr:aldehyde dehydrogenase family protein [Chloroflexota bacterium]